MTPEDALYHMERFGEPTCGEQPVLIDAFCGAGGCTKGYQRAGFYVVGVDINRQPDYCGDELIRCDAVTFLHRLLAHEQICGWALSYVAAIHASPPCKRYTVAGAVDRAKDQSHLFEPHPDLLTPTREALKATGLPFVIENVPGAPLIDPVTYCGSSFGLGVRRHRLFESNVPLTPPPCDHKSQPHPVGVYGNGGAWTRTAPGGGGVKVVGKDAADALGIDWTERQSGLSQAIPPAYTEHIGSQLLAHLGGSA